MLQVTWKDQEVSRWLEELQRRGANPRPLWADFGERLKNSLRQNILAAGRPVPWPPLKTTTLTSFALGKKSYWTKSGKLNKAGQKALAGRRAGINSGLLLASLHWRHLPGGVGVEGLRRGFYLHYGTPAHLIRPRFKRALHWPGALHPVKLVHHPGTPPRPFIMVQPEDWVYLSRRAWQYLSTGRLG